MTLTDLAIQAELKHIILQSAVMVNDGESKEIIIENLMSAVQLIEDNQPSHRVVIP